MFFAIALGGAIGAVLRYATSLAVVAVWGVSYQPAATILVNAVGSGVMGGCYALIGLGVAISDPMRGLLMVGFLGALTTFSSFSMDAINIVEKGMYGVAIGYVVASVVVSLLSFALVMGIVRAIAGGIGGVDGF